jgi:2Fe-2S ferredoxin
MPRVRFDDVGVDVQVRLDETLYEICLDHDIDMEAACGGFAACNTCRVRVLDGALSPMDDIERPFLDRPDQRLGCQARVVQDVVLTLDPGEI